MDVIQLSQSDDGATVYVTAKLEKSQTVSDATSNSKRKKRLKIEHFGFFIRFNNCRSIVIFVLGVIVFISFCCYAGVLFYAAFHDCDPKLAGLVEV